MKKLLVVTALLISACGGSSKSTPKTAQQTADDSMLDPTLPSWAPKNCVAYHKVAVEAMDCTAIEQSRRDQIQQQYGDASTAWKAETNADNARVEEIAQVCDRSSAAVHAEIAGNCAEAK
jgi:hypothetical protein